MISVVLFSGLYAGYIIKVNIIITGDYFSFYYSEYSAVIGTWLFIGKQAKKKKKKKKTAVSGIHILYK